MSLSTGVLTRRAMGYSAIVGRHVGGTENLRGVAILDSSTESQKEYWGAGGESPAVEDPPVHLAGSPLRRGR